VSIAVTVRHARGGPGRTLSATLWVIALWVIAPGSLAAQSKVDSLLARLHQVKDSARVDVLADLAGALARSDARKALEYGAMARDEAAAMGYARGRGVALYQMGLAHYNRQDFEEAAASYRDALDLLLPLSATDILGYVYNHLGNADARLGKQREAVEAYANAIHWQGVAGDSVGLAFAHNNLGLLYWQTSRYDSALVHYRTVLRLREALGDTAGVASIVNSIGVIHYRWGNYEEALRQYLRSLELRRGLGDRKGTALVLNNIGKTYQDWGQLDRAEESFREGLSISEALGDPMALGYSLNNLGALLEAQGQLSQAEATYARSLQVYRDAGLVDGTILNLTSLGHLKELEDKPDSALVLLREAVTLARGTTNREQEARALAFRGLAHQGGGDLGRAVTDLTTALAISREIGQRQLSQALLGYLADAHAARGEYRLALEDSRSGAVLKDSLFNESSGRRIATMQADLEIARRERENVVLRSAQETQAAVIARQRQGFLLGGVLLVTVGILALVLLRADRASRRANLALEEKNRALNEAMENIKTLSGFIPICSHCKKIRDDEGFWEQVETYISRHSEALFSHGICPDCLEAFYPELGRGDASVASADIDLP
jgi:tetratricopeptide (TPR) repeat protein